MVTIRLRRGSTAADAHGHGWVLWSTKRTGPKYSAMSWQSRSPTSTQCYSAAGRSLDPQIVGLTCQRRALPRDKKLRRAEVAARLPGFVDEGHHVPLIVSQMRLPAFVYDRHAPCACSRTSSPTRVRKRCQFSPAADKRHARTSLAADYPVGARRSR